MSVVKNYLSLIKFSHTIFAMPFALIGFSLGIYKLATINLDLSQDIGIEDLLNRNPWVLLLLVVMCMVFARSAAMAFNRYLDRQFDAKNPRTAIREIPAGILKADSVLMFTIFCSVAFVATTWFINPLCFYLSPVALLVVLGYSFTKRFTALCHLVLGVGLSLAPIGAYLAVTGVFDWLPLLFSFTVICWVSGFDIIYALQDEEFDKNNQLHSIPAALGKVRALIVSRSLHMLSAGFVISAGLLGDFTFIYWIGVAVFVGMLVYQHSIVKPTDLRRVNIAFMTANGIASVVFAVFVITDIFFG
ncbi:MAG: putative 4-hydroxybenzoate polyprenyltransferase [Chitinophagaceae bacterium]|nr:putative 4-hydroxybenzoate polyprenyltransferase [Chitinophagaceae bacterium]